MNFKPIIFKIQKKVIFKPYTTISRFICHILGIVRL